MIAAELHVVRSEGRLAGFVVLDGRSTGFSGTLELLRVLEDLVSDDAEPSEIDRRPDPSGEDD